MINWKEHVSVLLFKYEGNLNLGFIRLSFIKVLNEENALYFLKLTSN